ncbi:hypothetical protein OS493_009366 [Desmophyllum pertusum]|uniref:Protein kinase domain-containing protein n=1 Tax=Desmophyllum pertusum TaxID=174260 RepID=A0A9X0CSN1_9CNID|nr:hypothetical protein OS493_009366 [Desmophyllum pertusum]
MKFVDVLAGDDTLKVFADGDLVGQNGGIWNAAKWFSFPRKTKLIAVSVDNTHGGTSGFLGLFSNRVITDRSWKCKEITSSLEDGWERTNYTDDTWPLAIIRNVNRQTNSLPVVLGISRGVHWISPANHFVNRFICRRRFSEQRKARNSTLISIHGQRRSHTISLYLDGVYTAKVSSILSLVRDQHKLQAVKVEDRSGSNVSFIASSSNGVRTDKWWRCTSQYHKGWFLPSYDDSSWSRAHVGNDNFTTPFIAPDAKWIGNVFPAKKIYCRRNTTLTPVVHIPHDTTTASPTRPLQPSPSTVYQRTSIAGSTVASTTVHTKTGIADSTIASTTVYTRTSIAGSTIASKTVYTRTSIAGSTITSTTGSQNNTSLPRAPGTSASPPRAPDTSAPSSTDANRISTLLIVVIAVSGVTALVIGLAVPCYVWGKRRNRRKHQTNDKWEMNSDDVIVCEELGKGAFGKVCKGILKTTSCMAHGLSVQKTGKKREKSTIIVAVKMLQENATPDQKNDFLEEISLMKAVGSHKNIVSLIGCCTKSSPNFLIVEFASKGDLLSYLKERRKKVTDTNAPYMKVRESLPTPPRRPSDQNNPGNDVEQKQDEDEEDALTPKDVMSFSWQTAKGMEYLSGKALFTGISPLAMC